jgi:hypothetical protein
MWNHAVQQSRGLIRVDEGNTRYDSSMHLAEIRRLYISVFADLTLMEEPASLRSYLCFTK